MRICTRIWVFIFLLLGVLVGVIPASGQTWANGYAHSRTITISHTKVSNTTQVNFPVLISGTYPYLATTANGGQVTNSNGYDIIFTSDAGGAVPLPYEREAYAASSGAVNFWVQVPSLSPTTDTTIYMFYGNSSVTTDQSNKTAVWDSNYKGVWHSEESSGNLNDSTSNNNPATPSSLTQGVSGEIGTAAAYNGSSSHAAIGNLSLFNPTRISVSAWVNATSYPNSYNYILSKEQSADPYFGCDLRVDGGNLRFYIATGGAGSAVSANATEPSTGVWHYVVGTFDGSNIRLFVDGAQASSVGQTGNMDTANAAFWLGGSASFSGRNWNGSIEEARISSIARSPDWIATEYNNQSSPSTFYTIGSGDWVNGYNYRRAITIDHTKVPNTDQSNFPLLVSGTYSDLATTANGGLVTSASGYDIILTSDAGGSTPLAYERETYVASTGAVNFWVSVPDLSHTADTTIYMFYGNSSVTTDQSSPTNVWAGSYAGVWHLNESPTGSAPQLLDSTANQNNGTAQGSWTNSQQVSGPIGTALSFVSSSSNYISTANSLNNPQTETVQAWFKSTSTAGNKIIGFESAQTGTGSSSWDRDIWLGTNGKLFGGFYPCTSPGSLVSSNTYNDGNWHQASLTVDMSAQQAKLYVDGAQVGSTVSCSSISGYSGYYRIGAYKEMYWTNGNDGYFNGAIEEARVSLAARLGDWIATEYNNQSSPSTFYALSSSVTPPTLTSLSPSSGGSGTSVTINGTNFGSAQGSNTVTFNGMPANPTSWSNSQIVVPVPSGGVSGNVVVTVSGLPSNGLSFTDDSTSIVELLPASGPISTPVTIVGVNFGSTQGASVVSFNGTLANPTSWSNTQIVVPVPTGTSSGNVVVTVASGSTNGLPFTVTVPTIAALSPSIGPTGTSVTVSGSSFGLTQSEGSSTVTFNGTAATPTSWSSTSIVVTVPSAAATGNVVVTVAGVASGGVAFTVEPCISSLSPSSGLAGTSVTIAGTGFGATQGSSTVTFNGTSAVVTSWSDTSITAVSPNGATSGNVVVTVGGNASNGEYFTVLPTGWLDQDVGSVGTAGSAVYANGVFTITGGGAGVDPSSATDAFNYMYQSLSGDGTIVARVTSEPGTSSYSDAGVMIRETFNTNATTAFTTFYAGQEILFITRSTTGGNAGAYSNSTISLPQWVKVVRSGSSFNGYQSTDGINWNLIEGSPTTISMAQNVYIGLGVAQGQASHAVTATLDYVSVSTTAAPAPSITNVSANTAAAGSQITITGTGFGSSQGSSIVVLDGTSAPVDSWSSTSITFTVPANAASGPLAVLVAPSMNATNPITFTVTSQPLPSGWLDQDIGTVGTAGGATYSNGVFTVSAGGSGVYNSADAFNFAYQSINTDGKLVARVTSIIGDSSQTQAGVMFRETLNANATTAFTADYDWSGQQMSFFTRSSTGANVSFLDSSTISLPYWVMVERSGSTFIAFQSPDGVNWTQTGSTTTISMAQNAYIGLGVAQGGASGPVTATFDNVTISSELVPYVSSVSPTSGVVGTSVTINGSDFGSSQGTSTISFGGAAAGSITSWSSTQIVVSITSNLYSGPVVVTVAGVQSNSNVTFTCLTPVVSSLLPPAGPVAGSIVIQGHSFGASQGSSTAQFNGSNATIASWSDTSITATVPSGATSGPVTVTTGGVTSNGVQFSVIEPATVTALSPNTGPLATAVTITGTGFGAAQSDSTVYFSGIPATVINSWSDTQIVAVVPPYTGTGPVSVTVAGINASGPTFTLSRLTQLTDSLGNVSTYSASVLGGEWKPTGETGTGCSTCSSRGVINTTYDGNGNVLTRTDSAGNTTTYTYDASNDLLSESVQLNGTTTATTSYTYNSLGEVLTVTDPLGNVTTNTYDSHGNLLTVTSPAPSSGTAASVTQFAYNSLGELTTITDPLSHVTTMTYTTAGLIATITDAQNNVTTYGYDAKGDRTSVTDALSHTTTFTYDAMSRLTQITYPDSTTSSFTYDIRGRRTSATDQNGKTTSYAYDDADRLTSVTDAASHVTTYGYDTETNLTSITDANSNQTAFTYDAFGRVTKTTFPSALSETYQYDADNNLTQKTDRNGSTIQYLYDALNRLTQKTYPDTTTVEYTYDLVGKILQVNDPTGTYAFAYDNMGRLIGTTTSYSFLTSRSFTNAYTYDAASNRTGFTDPEGGSTSYAYDTLNLLTSLAPPSAFGSGSFGFSYDALSRRTQMTRPNSVTTNYSYDNLSRLTSVLHQLSGSTIDGAGYTLDSAGNRIAKTDQLAAVTSNYTYDPIYQLTQVTQANNTTESYGYDPVGNRTASLGVSSYTTNASNELTATSNASYTYDSNGNTLTKTAGSNTTTYAWDFENRLTSVTLPGTSGTVTFKYDPFGRRIYKSSSAGTTSIFVYDGESLTEETNSAGSAVARYTQGQDIDESLALLRGTTTDYYDSDGLGSVTSLTASNGSIAQSYTYDSFGNATNSSGSLTNSFRYTAREFDAETNLYNYRARYYDPGVGRFLSEDPIQFDGGINFYGYTANDPVGLIDPSGMSPAQGNANGFWPPANLDDPALSPIAHFPWPSSGRFYGVGQGPAGGQQCVALTRHFTGLPCTDCWRAGPKVIGNTIPAGTPVATFNGNGRYPQSGNANSGIYVSTYPGNKIVIVDQWPPNAVTHGPAKPAGARTLGPAPGDPSDDSGSYSVITVPRGTESSHCKCGNW